MVSGSPQSRALGRPAPQGSFPPLGQVQTGSERRFSLACRAGSTLLRPRTSSPALGESPALLSRSLSLPGCQKPQKMRKGWEDALSAAEEESKKGGGWWERQPLPHFTSSRELQSDAGGTGLLRRPANHECPRVAQRGRILGCQCRRHKRLRFDPWVGRLLENRNGNLIQYSCS